MAKVTLITTGWPIVVLVCPARLDAEWIADLDTKFRLLFARKERFAVLAETAALVAMPSALERKQLTTWTSRPDQVELQKRFTIGTSTIVRNALMRGAAQALHWFWTPVSPQNAARDFDEAWAWCSEQVVLANLPLPVPLLALKRCVEDELVGRRTG